jgi:hypothetical protein
MKTSSSFRPVSLLLGSVILIMACDLATSATATDAPQPSATETLEGVEPSATTQADGTATESAQVTDGPTNPAPTVVPSQSCTVLQDLNLRAGPGRAYNPPIGALPASTVFTPLAYQAVGIPGGSWVQVQNNQQKGWVSAGADFISCNFDLTTLPQVTVAPPPTPVPPRAQSSNEDGTCGQGGLFDDQGHLYDCAIVFSGGMPIQIQILKDGQEVSAGEVQNVVFRVDRNGSTVYDTTENTAAYCLFGGDGPCNSWVLENYVYKWESGGAAIEAGDYEVDITANMNNPSINIHWQATVTISLQ